MALSYKPDNGHLHDETPLPPPPPPALSIDNGSINDNDEAADVVPTTTPWYKQTRVHIALLSIWAMALIVAAATIFRPGGIGNKGSVIQSSQATSINSDSTYNPTFFPTFYPTISPVVPIVEDVTVNSKSQKDPPAVEEEIVVEEEDGDGEVEITVTIPTPTTKPTFGFTFPDQFNTPTPPPVTTGFPTTYMPTEESTNQQTVTVSTEVTSGATTPCREGEDCD
ncbi:hypothetical protein ACHAWC_009013 [Mediolabrus comicus]